MNNPAFSSMTVNPVMVLIRTGKKQIVAASAILEAIPNANQAMNTGARATRGVDWNRMITG